MPSKQPPPRPRGALHVRMPSSLHAKLLRLKDEENVSLNQLVVSLIAGGVGFKLPKGKGGK
jgi:predicted HicB family RNase H-like nuclease